jgi:hypothetical protein
MTTNQPSTESIEMGVLGSALLDPDKVIVFAVNRKKVLPNGL